MLRIAGTMEFTGIETKIRARRVEAMKQSAAAGFGDSDNTNGTLRRGLDSGP